MSEIKFHKQRLVKKTKNTIFTEYITKNSNTTDTIKNKLFKIKAFPTINFYSDQ